MDAPEGPWFGEERDGESQNTYILSETTDILMLLLYVRENPDNVKSIIIIQIL